MFKRTVHLHGQLPQNCFQIIGNSHAEAKWASCRMVRKELFAFARFEVPFLLECSVIQSSSSPPVMKSLQSVQPPIYQMFSLPSIGSSNTNTKNKYCSCS